MDRQTLIAAWFRQQAELLMPDPVIDPALAALLCKPVSVAAVTKKAAVQPAGGPSHRNNVPEVKRQVGSLSSRLSSLRPVDQLVATRQDSALAPVQPVAVSTSRVSDKRAALKDLYMAGCTKCHLAQTRTTFVFGAGNAEAPVMVIGEAPGREEDEQGLPFVGAAGKLLTSMLAAIGLDRNNDVFIGNVLKCRPPGNRNPESLEIITCIPLLRQQIEIIAPKAILLLGRIAAHALLDVNDSIAKMRQKVFDYNGIPVMVIYHPAALLRNAEYKRPAWEDLQQFKQLLTTSGVYGLPSEK